MWYLYISICDYHFILEIIILIYVLWIVILVKNRCSKCGGDLLGFFFWKGSGKELNDTPRNGPSLDQN